MTKVLLFSTLAYMYLVQSKLKELCKTNGLSLQELLYKANVSKTAYYHLIYKETLLPNSVHAIAKTLNVRPSVFLEEANPEEEMIRQIMNLTEKILNKFPKLDRENVRHTLLLLHETPIERLKRGLRRGQKFNLLR